MDIIHLFLFRDIVKEVKSLCRTRLQKKYLIILTCFVLHSLRFFFILYASLRNNVYGTLSFFTSVDVNVSFYLVILPPTQYHRERRAIKGR